MTEFSTFITLGVVGFVAIISGIIIRISQKSKKAERASAARMEQERSQKRADSTKYAKTILWGDRFVIDKGLIDKDHKTLFVLINKFNQRIPHFKSVQEMAPILVSLQAYMQTHFKREEKLQQLSSYPFRDQHRAQHGALIEELEGLLRKAGQATDDTITDVAVEIGTFLRNWITVHVVESDLPLRPYVDRMKEYADSMGKLK